MADFQYLIIDRAGRERGGGIAAESIEDARLKLERKRLYVVRLERAGTTVVRAKPLFSLSSVRRSKLGNKDLTLFTRQLATLALVTPLEEALRTIAHQSESDAHRLVLDRVHAGVLEGRRMSDAMAREPRSFPALYRAMIAAGESAGTLPEILDRLADLQERQAAIRSKITTTLAYPVVLAVVAGFVIMSLMIFVVPKVVDQFDSVGQELPLLTRIVMGISAFLANYWWILLLIVAGAVALAWRAMQVEDIRLRVDTALLKLPVIGKLMRDLHAARMARTLSTMVASRLPLLEGLVLTGKTIRNYRLRKASDEIVQSVRSGGSLSGALKRTALFPPLLVYLTASGEASGQLETMLERAADYLEREFDGFTATALSLLEPAIIVVMGAVVALIVLSILLPILQLETLAGT
jgi:general secretion pathway protein F